MISFVYTYRINKFAICLSVKLERRAVIRSYPVERVNAISTYEELQIIISIALLIIAILTYTHRK